MEYDSTNDTKIHIGIVAQMLLSAAKELADRSQVHDASKLKSPEKEYFDEYTPKLRAITYGTQEYIDCLRLIEPALAHHYEKNPHHPEHHPNGIAGMNLFDLVEMFFDWWAATKRHNDGNILTSIDHNEVRFELSTQLAEIFRNTVTYCRLNLNDPEFTIKPSP